MQSYDSDPKPGRLILPLVLIGMIATTYTFINRVTTNNNLELTQRNNNNYSDFRRGARDHDDYHHYNNS